MRFLKLLLVVLALLAVATMCTVVRAQESECVTVAKLARAIMVGRQAGLPMEQVYQMVTLPESRYMVVEAYKIPRFKTREFVDSEVDEFAARMMGKCLEGTL